MVDRDKPGLPSRFKNLWNHAKFRLQPGDRVDLFVCTYSQESVRGCRDDRSNRWIDFFVSCPALKLRDGEAIIPVGGDFEEIFLFGNLPVPERKFLQHPSFHTFQPRRSCLHIVGLRVRDNPFFSSNNKFPPQSSIKRVHLETSKIMLLIYCYFINIRSLSNYGW